MAEQEREPGSRLQASSPETGLGLPAGLIGTSPVPVAKPESEQAMATAFLRLPVPLPLPLRKPAGALTRKSLDMAKRYGVLARLYLVLANRAVVLMPPSPVLAGRSAAWNFLPTVRPIE